MSLLTASTKRGTFVGVSKGDYTLFAGIPYAKAPVGERRFQKPERLPETEEVFDALRFSGICPQGTPKPGSFYEREFYQDWGEQVVCQEDCLYLNVWTPAEHTGEGLPVLFWIHGGAFDHGYGHEIEFDGEAYCKRGVILVTINYRLGIWGFLSHPEINGGIGNVGIRDQICALDWVYENIEAFGGNPQAITVAGQSAGGYSVQALLTSKLTKGKIAGAIMQSGGCINPAFSWCITKEHAWENAEAFCRKHGIDRISRLLDMSVSELQSIAEDFHGMLTIDGEVLEQDCNQSMQDGIYPGVPYLAGANRRDLDVTEEMLEKGIPSAFYQGAEAFAVHGSDRGLPVYMYLFSHPLPGDDAGSFHSGELWYMFGTLNRCWRPMTREDREISERMLDCWSAFVKQGSPETDSIKWPAYQKERPFVMEF